MELIFRPGDKVHYVSGNHGATRNNPLMNSKYECTGIVTRVRASLGGSFTISVDWDNGSRNSYIPSDLQPASDNGSLNPNLSFLMKKQNTARRYH